MTKILRTVLRDWRTLIRALARNPTHIPLLVPQDADYVHHTDACGLGAGGVIRSGRKTIKPIVWQFEWPKEIREKLITDKNPSGTLTINDLELAGIVLGWLIMEIAEENLEYSHIGMFCDNTSATSWASKGHSTKSIPAARLLRFLNLRQRTRKVSSLTTVHIAGVDNEMADICSRAFREGKFFMAHTKLCTFFNTTFPLQNESWTEFYLPKGLYTRVISCLLGEQAPMESLVRLPKIKRSTGSTGVPTPTTVARTPSSQKPMTSQEQPSSWASPRESELATMDWDQRSKFRESQKPWHPSPRPSNWLTNPVPSIKMRPHTYFPSNDVSRDSDDRTQPQSHS